MSGGLSFVQDPFNEPEGAVIEHITTADANQEVFIGILTSPLKCKWPY